MAQPSEGAPPRTTPEHAHALIGALLDGKYRIVRVLGEGGMGTVFEATQVLGATMRHVAVKTLHAHLASDTNLRARFERECAVLARVSHPNTVQLIDYGVAETVQGPTAFLVMELVNGKSLRDLIVEEAPLEPMRVLAIVRQIGSALAEAHANGVVHRDLKPENVVLVQVGAQPDFVKLLDFGIAKNDADNVGEKLTQHGAVLGTPAYMSPEQLLGDTVDLRSDIFSLGLIAYEMLSGKLPFGNTEPWQLMNQRLTAEPEPFDGAVALATPPAMQQAIARAIRRRSIDRFSSVENFIDAMAGKAIVEAEPPQPPAIAFGSAPTLIPGQQLPPRPRHGTLPSGTDLEEAARRAWQAGPPPDPGSLGRVPAGATEIPRDPVHVVPYATALGSPPAHGAPTQPQKSKSKWPLVAGGIVALGMLGGFGALALSLARDKPEVEAGVDAPTQPIEDAALNIVDDAELPELVVNDAATPPKHPTFDAGSVVVVRDASARDAMFTPDVRLAPPDALPPLPEAGRRFPRDGGRIRIPWWPLPRKTRLREN